MFDADAIITYSAIPLLAAHAAPHHFKPAALTAHKAHMARMPLPSPASLLLLLLAGACLNNNNSSNNVGLWHTRRRSGGGIQLATALNVHADLNFYGATISPPPSLSLRVAVARRLDAHPFIKSGSRHPRRVRRVHSDLVDADVEYGHKKWQRHGRRRARVDEARGFEPGRVFEYERVAALPT